MKNQKLINNNNFQMKIHKINLFNLRELIKKLDNLIKRKTNTKSKVRNKNVTFDFI